MEGLTLWLMSGKGACCAEGLVDAAGICEQLGIPHHVVDTRDTFQQEIVQRLVDGYRDGITPLPCSQCNRSVKFGPMLEWAAEHRGLPRIATGHYARIRHGGAQGRHQLLRGLDCRKDQSYFLHQVGHQALGRSLFPVGNVDKTLVREKAASAGFVTARKKDSTGICFIGERRFRDFLKQYLPAQPGPIVSVDGDELGEHEGLMYHTIGQRQGLRIGGLANRPEAPWYVVDKNVTDNVLVVAQGNEHPALFKKQLTATDVIWISGEPPTLPLTCHAKIRYRQVDQPCEVFIAGAKIQVSFATPQRAVTPGQSVVFYEGDICLGGGVIEGAQ